MDLSGKTAFITGASQGIGKACALELARAGADVVLASRNLERLEKVADEVRAVGPEALVVSLDLANPDTIKPSFARAQEKF